MICPICNFPQEDPRCGHSVQQINYYLLRERDRTRLVRLIKTIVFDAHMEKDVANAEYEEMLLQWEKEDHDFILS